MSANAKASEQIAVLGTIDPATVKTTAVESDRVDPKLWKRLMVILNVGTIADDLTVTLLKSTATTGGTTTALTTLSVASSSDNTQQVLSWNADTSYDSAAPYVSVKVSAADTNANTISAVVLGVNGHYLPASDNDLASVVVN